MFVRRAAAIAALTVAATGIASGVSYAEPETSPNVSYTAGIVDNAVVTTIDAGAFRLSGDGSRVDLQNGEGATLVSLPLVFNLGNIQFPFDRTISEDGRTLTLTPNLDPARSEPKPVADELAPPATDEEKKAAMDMFQSQLGLATQIGSLTGTIIGAVIGCVVGLPGLIVGCLPGMATGASIGGIAGTILAGGGTAVVAGFDLMRVLNSGNGSTLFQ
ncbi:ammonium transporter [Rhodococcus sp. 27YEA15]|uniref:ammonium transporter n=1 Tax=Rhodococcus sp. 27YEA15 TaxID=3156259 RepID=UPI003C7E6FF9